MSYSERLNEEKFIQRLKEARSDIEYIGGYTKQDKCVTCKCVTCGKIWRVRAKKLLDNKTFCPTCNPQARFPSMKTQEEFEEEISSKYPNLQVIGKYRGNDNLIKCKCKVCEYEFEAKARKLRTCGHSCLCTNKALPHEVFVQKAEIANPSIKVIGNYQKSKVKVSCQCKRCGHIWDVLPANLLKGRGCPNCANNQTSFAERVLLLVFRKLLGDDSVLERDKTAIGMEIDIYIPSMRFGIEIGSWYWHQRKLEHDLEKYNKCKESGIKLLTVYDDFDEQNLNFGEDFITYDKKFNDAKDNGIFKQYIIDIVKRASLPFTMSDEELNNIFIQARIDTKRKDTKTIMDEIASIHPTIELLDEYQGTKVKMRFNCKVCGHQWYANYDHLVRRRQGCPNCFSKKKCKSVRNIDTGEVFESLSAAARKYNMSGAGIKLACKRKDNNQCKGYRWEYV